MQARVEAGQLLIEDGAKDAQFFVLQLGRAAESRIGLAVKVPGFGRFEAGDAPLEGRRQPAPAEVGHIDVPDTLHQAVAHPHLEAEVGQHRLNAQLVHVDHGVDEQLQPEPQLGHLHGPAFDIDTVEAALDDALLAVIGRSGRPPASCAGQQVVKHVERAHQERARAAGRVAHGDAAQQAVDIGPEVGVRDVLIGLCLLVGLQGKDQLVDQRKPVAAEGGYRASRPAPADTLGRSRREACKVPAGPVHRRCR